ncbi:hypothetical protein J2Y38_003518 [Flavobacterium sp. 2755]|uniref:hypothetical protein n=1 Tax=Flavobacterium sp. 2755 TaxID=2817765 RepID=UPI00285A1AF8|nr:hypothetical protein [Flavobacterium sp. 2755]MDR6763299.1 hypothetical protein [Flavobacterium sp. 2755]
MKIKPFKIILPLLTFFSLGCKNPEKKKIDNQESNEMTEADLLHHVRLAINPKFQDWVLFENGTYIIFDNADTIPDLESEAIKLMKEFGPVHAGGPAGDFSVIHLKETEGWIVSGHGYGMYTYVNPNELGSEKPDDVKIGLEGRSKRNADGQNPVIIHINRKGINND